MSNFGTPPAPDPTPYGENPNHQLCTCISVMEITGYIQIVTNGDGTCTSTIVDGGVESSPGYGGTGIVHEPPYPGVIFPNPGSLKARQFTACVPSDYGPTGFEIDIPGWTPGGDAASGGRIAGDDLMIWPHGHLKYERHSSLGDHPSNGKKTSYIYISYKVAKVMGSCSCEDHGLISDTGWNNFQFNATKPCQELLPFIEKVISAFNPHKTCSDSSDSWHPPLV
jgi:hypothetical protein